MSVQLLPPVSSSGGMWRGELPLLAARRYVRGAGNSRWHRIRSGAQWPDGRITVNYWCGQMAFDGPGKDRLLNVDEVPEDQPVCGTCEGRALGAGQDPTPDALPDLVFSPRWRKPPTNCPGSRDRDLWDPIPNGGHSVGKCLACGDIVSIRAMGRGYNAWGAGATQHPPGQDLVEACPFHAWNRIRRRDGEAKCGCGWPDDPRRSYYS